MNNIFSNARIEAIRNSVLNGNGPAKRGSMWAGADLVISGKAVTGMAGKVVVVTKYAAELSDLIFELKEACSDWLDYMNKYYFFPSLGEAALSYLKNAADLKGLLLSVINEAEQLDEYYNRTLYFAYGSNMDEAQMASRCPGARLVKKTTVPGYRFALDEAGVATIIPEVGAIVEGLLWEITPENQNSLDRYEGVAHNCYRKEKIHIRSGKVDGNALVYISNRALGAKRERSGYMEKIIRAASDHDFSKGYIQELRSHYNALEGSVQA